jgi:hypothetical protein
MPELKGKTNIAFVEEDIDVSVKVFTRNYDRMNILLIDNACSGIISSSSTKAKRRSE